MSEQYAETVACAHCGQTVKPSGKRCRHGVLCGPCEWELNRWADQSDGTSDE